MKYITIDSNGEQEAVTLTASSIGAETPTGAQTKADSAKTQANSYTDGAISTMLGGAPAMLDTLYELSNALGNDPDFSATILNLIGTKASSIDVYTKVESDGRYAPSGYGLGTTTINYSGNDLDVLMGTQWVSGYNMINAPVANHTFVVYHCTYLSTSGGSQIAINISNNLMYNRSKITGVWTHWKQLATTDNPVFTGHIKSYNNSLTTPIGLYLGRTSNTVDAVLGVVGGTGDYCTTAVQGNLVIGNVNNSSILFTTSSTIERMRISGAGNVGIGTIAPQATLHGTGSTILGVGISAVVDAGIGTNQCNIWLNEATNTLTFRVKYSNGLLKTATLALS